MSNSSKIHVAAPYKNKSHVLEIDDRQDLDGRIDKDELREAFEEEENIRDILKNHDTDASRTEQVLDAMLTLEIAHQKGVDIQGDIITVPGRVSITPISALQFVLLLILLGCSSIHFLFNAPNWMLTVAVIFIIELGSIIVYLTASLAQRGIVQGLQLLWTTIFTGLVDWGYIDHIHFLPEGKHYALLVAGVIAFNLIMLLFWAHFVFFGRGTRNIKIKRKTT